jgi:hypothetical protein
MTTGTVANLPQSAPRMTATPPRFLAGAELVPAQHGGRSGVQVTVRLTDYRSLPLSCLAGIEISIDGTVIDPAGLVLVLDGEGYRLPDLRERTDLWWFVLDPAELFIPLETPLEPGHHEVTGTLHLIVPYATVGRSLNSSITRVRLPLASPGLSWS